MINYVFWNIEWPEKSWTIMQQARRTPIIPNINLKAGQIQDQVVWNTEKVLWSEDTINHSSNFGLVEENRQSMIGDVSPWLFFEFLSSSKLLLNWDTQEPSQSKGEGENCLNLRQLSHTLRVLSDVRTPTTTNGNTIHDSDSSRARAHTLWRIGAAMRYPVFSTTWITP